MKKYSTVSDNSETTDDASQSYRRSVNDSNNNNNHDRDSVSVASSQQHPHRRFKGHKRISSELSEPLTSHTGTFDEESLLSHDPSDPYFVFRSDLQKKLDLIDDSLADYLRVVHETVRQRRLVWWLHLLFE
jgi:hypothetical protein